MQIDFERGLTSSWVAFSNIVTPDSNETYLIQNRGPDVLLLYKSDTEPSEDSVDGVLIEPYSYAKYSADAELYLRAFHNNCSINISTVEGQGGGGGSANIEAITVTPSTSAQTITASGGADGYSPITVSAVTSSIDANIVASNIKDGVSILGVTGELVPPETWYNWRTEVSYTQDFTIAGSNPPSVNASEQTVTWTSSNTGALQKLFTSFPVATQSIEIVIRTKCDNNTGSGTSGFSGCRFFGNTWNSPVAWNFSVRMGISGGIIGEINNDGPLTTTLQQYNLGSASVGQYYYIKCVITDNTVTFSYSTDGESWTGAQTFTGSNGMLAALSTRYYNSFSYNNTYDKATTIDLSECYIKVDGQTVWTPYVAGPYLECYTLSTNPTTSTQVYEIPKKTSALTITAVGTGTITLSDSKVYNRNSAGDVESPVLGTKTITSNDTYTAASDYLDGFSSVTVDVPSGGGDTVEAYNNTGSAISEGDKVWINSVKTGTKNYITQGNPIIDEENLTAEINNPDAKVILDPNTSNTTCTAVIKVKSMVPWVKDTTSGGGGYDIYTTFIKFAQSNNIYPGLAVLNNTTSSQYLYLMTSNTYTVTSLDVSTLVTGQWYWFKYEQTGTDWEISYSTDGTTYTSIGSGTDSSLSSGVNSLVFCKESSRGGMFKDFVYDLQESYLVLDNTRYDFYDNVINGKSLVSYSPINAEIIGSPLIDNETGVVQNFSTSDYLKIDKYPSTITSFEICFKVRIPEFMNSSHMVIMGQDSANYMTPQIELSADYGTIYARVSQNGTSWTSATQSLGSADHGVWMWIKAVWTGTSLDLYIKTTSDAAWSSADSESCFAITWNQAVKIGRDNDSASVYPGAIDLSESYININGETWWTGATFNINENTLTGTAAENIAVGASGDVNTVLPNS